jgi:hypothetical protein
MIKILFVLLMLSAEITLGQLHLPDWSPRATISQHIGYTQFEVQYGRPAARQRKIMGELVPFKRLWRTGAGKGTRLSFSTDVVINNKSIPAGSYALVTIPDEKEWTVMLNSDTSKIYGDPSEYDVAREVVRLNVKPETTDRFYESLTIDFDIKEYDAELYLAWENTQIHFAIGTGSHQRTLTTISKHLEKNPNDAEAFSQAAFYYSMNNEDSAKSLQWLTKSLSIREDRWAYHQKINLLEKMKNYAEARDTANKALAYLNKEKPDRDGWEYSVKEIQEKMKSWPKK